MKRSRKKKTELNFWQSYSDMMAALLLVFVLIIAVTLTNEKATYEKKQKELEEKQEEISEYQEKIEEQQEQIDLIIGVKSEIIQQLTDEFSNTDLDITVDPTTGSIMFDSSVLFDYNQYNLTEDGIDFLNKFFPKYFEVILDDDICQYISEIIIEGHTDDAGQYLYNLKLSQERAYSVAEYCLDGNNDMFTDDQLIKVRQLVTANGRSFNDLIYDSENNVDAQASRRVEVKFRLTEEEMISQISALLEK